MCAITGSVAGSVTGGKVARQDSFQLPHSFEPETMPELIQVTELLNNVAQSPEVGTFLKKIQTYLKTINSPI